MMLTLALLLNFLASVGSAVASALALRRPQILSGSVNVDAGERFYVKMYAARSAPFGLLAGASPLLCAGVTVVAVLLVAAVIQFVDVLIALAKRDRGMMAGASFATIVHLVAAGAVFSYSL